MFGGEKLLKVFKVPFINSGVGSTFQTLYTVPAGRYAKVKANYDIRTISTGGGNDSSVQIGGVVGSSNPIATDINFAIEGVMVTLSAGEVIGYINGTRNNVKWFEIQVMEYEV